MAEDEGSAHGAPEQSASNRPVVGQLKKLLAWLVGFLGLVIIALTKSYIAEIVWPERKLAQMDSTLTKAWNYSDSTAQNKALTDLSDDAKTTRFQLHLVGRLVMRVRDNRRLQNTRCPSASKPLGNNDQLALSIIVRLSKELAHPHKKLYVFPQKPPPDLPDSLRFDSVDFSLAHFDSANLRKATFAKACLFKASLEGANLDSSDFTLGRLDSTNFRGATMRGTQLKSINSRGAQFRETVLSGAILEFAQLRSVNFAGADLTCAYFANAVTDSISLSGTGLSWADLFAIKIYRLQSPWMEIDNLNGAYLVGAVGLGPREIADARSKGAFVDSLDQKQWGVKRDENCRRLLPAKFGAGPAVDSIRS